MSLPRLLAGVHPDRPLSHAEHLAAHGPPGSRGRVLAAEVERAGLRGRGGAAFPTAIKLRSVAGRRGSRVVVVNAAEGEPMSAKDRVLLTLAPHLVLDGALAAADAIGARRIVVAVPRDANASASAVNGAVAERSLGRRVQVRAVPVVYLAGEETALIRHLDGGPLRPTVVPPLPSERGLGRRPTLVQNAETLAHLALIARHGADWYRRVGSDADPGSTLVTIGGAVARPGVGAIAR
ncbi:MAG TPA: hypothetical protein VHB30_09135, partial [Solirubrobacteraceae bacterium]|nr:hypothetical protein [Solirubrobacteraceae bacterium]